MVNPARPAVYILIDYRINNEAGGRLLDNDCLLLENFKSLIKLPYYLDQYFDRFKLPQKTHQLRGFRSENPSKTNDRGDDKVADEKMPAKGEKATFLVTVRYRQNATFQGSIKWLEANEERNFRSALEMIKLIDDAVIDENEDDAKW